MGGLISFLIGMVIALAVLAPFVVYSYYLNKQPSAPKLLPRRATSRGAKVIPFKRRPRWKE